MQVQISTKDTNTGEECLFTIISSTTNAYYFSWEKDGVLQQMMIDKASAHMLSEAVRRTANLPEIIKPKKIING